jgi:hypothetical protein
MTRVCSASVSAQKNGRRRSRSLISSVTGWSPALLPYRRPTLKAYKRPVVDGIRLYGEMHPFLPIYASWHGAKITEVIVTHYPRTTGRSKYGLERVAKVLLDLLVVKILDAFSHRPIHVFGGCGFFSLMISFLTFLWMISLKLFYGVPFITTPLPLMVVMTFMIGMSSPFAVCRLPFAVCRGTPINLFSHLCQSVHSAL